MTRQKVVLNVGAQYVGEDGRKHWLPSKRSLRLALTLQPDRVEFVQTSPFTQGFGQTFRADDARLREGDLPVELSVVGPNPWLDRRWYATVVDRRVTV